MQSVAVVNVNQFNNMKVFKRSIVLLLFIATAFGFAVAPAHADYRSDLQAQLDAAAGEQGADFGEATDPRIAAALFIRGVLTLMGTLVLAYMVWGGFLWMTAAGDQDQVEKAKKTIARTTIGLVIILSSYAVTLFASRLVELRDGPANPESKIFRIRECLQNSDCPNNGTCSNHICSPDAVQCRSNNDCPPGAVCKDSVDRDHKRCFDVTNQVQQINAEQQRFLNNDPLNQDATPFAL